MAEEMGNFLLEFIVPPETPAQANGELKGESSSTQCLQSTGHTHWPFSSGSETAGFPVLDM